MHDDGAYNHMRCVPFAVLPMLLLCAVERPARAASPALDETGVVAVATGDAERPFKHAFTLENAGAYHLRRLGEITVDGNRWRVELSAENGDVRPFDVVDGAVGRGAIAVNHTNRTWYTLPPGPVLYVQSVLNFHRLHPTEISKVTIREPVRGALDSDATGVAEIEFSYVTRTTIGPDTVRGHVTGRFRLVARGAPVAMQPLLPLIDTSTGAADIDERIRSAGENPAGLITEIELTITRTFEGGPPMTQTVRASLGKSATSDALPSDIEPPAEYVYQFPVVAAPAGSD